VRRRLEGANRAEAWLKSGECRLSEVDVTAQRGNNPRERRFGPLKRLVLAAGLVLIIAVAGVLIAQARARRARFLMVPADAIPRDPGLLRYAMARGASAYAEHCVSCHGAGMQGDPARAVPNLVDDDWLYGTGRVSEIEHVVLYGIRSGNSRGWDLAHMPAFATPHPYNLYAIAPLRPSELDDVTTYVLSFQHLQADAAAVERGKRVFHDTSKGNCTDCHGSDAKGDSAIGAPDLTDRIWLRGDGSKQTIEDSIAYGLAGRCPAWSAELSPVTVRALAVYVHMKGGRTKLE
jgi:cytochrome c oxidase cbb3-type subunit III